MSSACADPHKQGMMRTYTQSKERLWYYRAVSSAPAAQMVVRNGFSATDRSDKRLPGIERNDCLVSKTNDLEPARFSMLAILEARALGYRSSILPVAG